MIEWSEQHLMIRDMTRRFIDEEIKPRWHDLEHGDLPPYDILRKLVRTFGLDEMARQRFAREIEREKAAVEAKSRGETAKARRAAADPFSRKTTNAAKIQTAISMPSVSNFTHVW